MKTFVKYSSLLFLFFFLSHLSAYPQLIVTPGNVITMTPQEFVETYLVGSGVTVSNATFNGSSDPINTIQTIPGSIENQQIGNFTTSGSTRNEITFAGGVIMSSGKVSSAPAPPDFASTATNGPTGDPDLAKIAGTNPSGVLDQAILEFDFVPQTDVINFRYIFGSEEFDVYCNAAYNDAFGFFLSGPGIAGGQGFINDAVNIAILPNSTLPVTIHNICANKPLYSWLNDPEKDLAYNRFTYVFTATYSITCLLTYHIKLAISDVGDRVWDSGVFLEQNSFSSNDIVINTSFSNPLGGQNAIVNCSNAILQFQLPNPVSSDYIIDLSIDPGSTAPQSDFLPNPLPTTITIPAGQSQSPPLVITPISISQPGGTETLILKASHTVCGNTSSTSVSIIFKDKPPLLVSINPPPPGLICDGSLVSLTANVSGGYPDFFYSWPGGVTTNPANIIVSAGSPVVTVMVTDICADTTYASIPLTITTLPGAAGPITGAASICQPLNNVPYHIDPVAGADGYTWRTPPGVTAPPNPSPNDITLDFGVDAASGNLLVYGINLCGQGPSSTLPITIYSPPEVTFTPPGTTYCPNTPAFPLTFGTPAGGIYSGTGVTNIAGIFYFDPSLANIGANILTYTYTSPAGCQASANGTLIVNPLPDVSFTPSHPSLRWCSADPVSIALSSSISGAVFNWTASAGPSINPSSINNGSGNINQAFINSGSNVEPVLFQVSATANGCTSNLYPYTVQINPVASVSASPSSQVICSETASAAVNLTSVPASGVSFNWSFSGPADISPATGSGLSNPVPSIIFTNSDIVQETVSYIVNTSFDNCPGNTGQFTVLVNPRPSLTNSPMSQSVCLGNSSVRVDFISSVPYPTSYQWIATPSPASITGYITGLQTTAYIPVQTLTDPSNSTGTVTYTITPRITLNSVTCSGNISNYIINTDPLPTPDIQTVQAVCELTTGVVYSTPAVANHNYLWTISGGTITSASNIPSIIADWGSSGTGSLTVVESVASTNPVCQSSDTKTVTILPRPLPTITADHSLSNGICLGQTGHYQTQPGMSDYIWTISAGGTIISQINQNLSVKWITSGPKSVSVNYTAANGCSALTPGSISFNANPLPDVTLSGPIPALACEGQASSFNTPADPNSNFTWSLLPSNAGSLSTPQGQSTAIYTWTAPAANATVSVAGLNNYGCSATNQVNFTVNPKPAVTFSSCFDPVTIPSARPFILRGGIPLGSGGIYSGEGISLNGGAYEFDPVSVSGPFPKTVVMTYTYTNIYGCPSSNTKSIQLVNPPVFQCENPLMPLKDVRTNPYRAYNTYWRGNRCWMIQDLDYGISVNTQLAQTDNCQPEKFCPLSDPSCTLSGGFYQWDELMQYVVQEGVQGLCPPGWHIPSKDEWQMLIDDPSNSGNSLAGGYLRDVPFSAGLNGILYMNNTWEFLHGNNLSGTMFWTSTLNGSTKAWARGMNNFCPSVSVYSSSRANAFQVRCVKD